MSFDLDLPSLDPPEAGPSWAEKINDAFDELEDWLDGQSIVVRPGEDIQVAVNLANANWSAGSGPTTVVLVDGTYNLTATSLLSGTATYVGLIIRSGVTLRLTRRAILTMPPTGSGSYRVIVMVGDNVATVSNVVIEGGVIDGQATASGLEDQMGIAVANATDVTIRGVEVRNIRGDGIKCGEVATKGSNHVTVTNCYVHHCTGQAVGGSGNGADSSKNWTITDNHFVTSINDLPPGPGGAEVIICEQTCTGWIIANNNIEDWGSITLATDCHDIQIIGNRHKAAAGSSAAVLMNGSTSITKVVVANNVFDVSVTTASGIDMQGTGLAHIVITGNVIKRNSATTSAGSSGIHARDGCTPNGLVISDNVVYNAASTESWPDINIFGGGNDVTIANNVCLSFTTAIFCSADNATITGNHTKLGGIMADNAPNCTIVGNSIIATAPVFLRGGTGTGISIVHSQNSMVAGNRVEASGFGIGLTGSTSGCLVAHNRISASAGAHIAEFVFEGSTPNDNLMVPNKLFGTPGVTVVGANSVGIQSITGSRGGNAALANTLTALAKTGYIVNNTTA